MVTNTFNIISKCYSVYPIKSKTCILLDISLEINFKISSSYTANCFNYNLLLVLLLICYAHVELVILLNKLIRFNKIVIKTE